MLPRPAFPISLYVAYRKVIVVGTDERAHRQAQRLGRAGARVELVQPEGYVPEICRGAFAVLVYGDDHGFAREVLAGARALGCLGYAHDQPDVSDFALPGVARRGPLALAVSTDATAPALAGRLRRELQALLDRAGHALDRLLAELLAERGRQKPGAGRSARLAALAGRLRLDGDLVIAPPAGPEGAAGPEPLQPAGDTKPPAGS